MTGAHAPLRLDDDGDRLVVRDGDGELTAYVYRPAEPQFESPRPYFSPVSTRSGELVSLFRPHDHVWHKGISWSLPVVGDQNFWGGNSYRKEDGYKPRGDNGSQRHVGFDTASADDGVVRVVERLEWITQRDEHWFDEVRAFTVEATDDGTWVLCFSTRMTNVSAEPIAIGSPTTRGRENAGYGGLFWRGPRSFTGGTVLAPGIAGRDELRGRRFEWLGFTGRHDVVDAASTVVMVDAVDNVQHPPQWFTRSEEFACLCPGTFFSDEHEVAPGATLSLRYAVVVADGESDPSRAEALAAVGRSRLPGVPIAP